MSMEKIADGRPTPGRILIAFVSPSGAMAVPVHDGAVACRTFKAGCVLHVDAPGDGLIAEMEAGRQPLPWYNAEQRHDALLQIRDHRPDLDDDLRERLAAWIEATPWYE